jgi:1-acyl-sn-glycerol-3-phosphate acyltransferase
MTVLRLVLFWLLWALCTIVLGTVALVLCPFQRGGRLMWVQRRWAQVTLWLVAQLVGLRFRLTGEVQLLHTAGRQPCLWASQHQSAWETLAFAALVPRLRFVIKRELLRIPFYGWYHRLAGMVAVDRDGGMAALRDMVAGVRRSLADGHPVLIYPEGTRVPWGEQRPLLPGVAALYTEAQVPVIPVTLDSGRFWPKGLNIRPGLITVTLHPPIPPGLPRKAFQAELARVFGRAGVRGNLSETS